MRSWAGIVLSAGFFLGSVCNGRPLGAQQTVAATPNERNDAHAMAQALARRVTISLTHVSRAAAIDSISQVAKVFVQYSALVWDAHSLGVIDVHVKGLPLGTVLEQVLEGTHLHVVSDGHGGLMVMPISGSSATDSTTFVGIVTGHVIDSATGRGVAGATVKVVGTKLVVTASDSGRYTLKNVPVGERMVTVRAFGYRPAERGVTVTDGNTAVVRIVLDAAPNILSGVVTTATGTQRRMEMGNDITVLNVDSIRQVAPISSLTDLLETRVPGLTVLHSSGDPGSPSRLRLRGVGSINGNNDPILIVDGIRMYSSQSDPRNDNLAPSASQSRYNGVIGSSAFVKFSAPSPIDQIDPNTIENVEVFKGPSAAAMYGADAANGVIVITTKKGRAGPTHWMLDLGGGVSSLPGQWPVNYFRFGQNVTNTAGPLCNWYDPTCVAVDSVRPFQALNDPQYTAFGRGHNQSASFLISGGVPVLQYSLTGSASGNVGYLKLPDSEQERYTSVYGPIPAWMVRPDNQTIWGVTGGMTAVPNPKFQITLSSSLFNSLTQSSSLQGAVSQLGGVYISGGTATYFDQTSNSLASSSLVTNYVQRVTDSSLTYTNNLSLSWFPVRAWSPITVTVGSRTNQRTDHQIVPFGININGPSGCKGLRSGAIGACVNDTSGYYGLGRGVSQNQTASVGTSIPMLYDHVNVAVGGQLDRESTNDLQLFTDQLQPGVSAPTSFLYPGCTNTDCAAGQASSASSVYGWYVEPRLNFNSKFFASPGFRLDGGSGGSHLSTTGGAAGGLSAFPKLDLSYIAVDRQNGRPLWGFLTMLRPRAAFGFAGRQPLPQERLRLFNVGSDQSTLILNDQGHLLQGLAACSAIDTNGNPLPTVCLSSLGNTQLHPERSRELESGFDITLWNGRFSMGYTQYNKTTKDAISSVPIAPSISQVGGGRFTIAKNIGEIRNTGTELTSDLDVLASRQVSWHVRMSLSNDNNVLVHLAPGQDPNTLVGLVPGYPVGGIWERPIVSFADQNNDHVIEPYEIHLGSSPVYMGQPNPKYQMQMSSDVTLLQRVSIHASFFYTNGETQTNQGALSSSSFLMVGNNPTTPLAYQAAVIAAICGSQQYTFSSCAVRTNYGLIQTVNTFRFQDLSINYQLPKSVSSRFRVPHAVLALQGSNLGLHTNYRGKDPDVNAFTTVSSVDETVDLGQIPEPRTWWLKLTLGN